MMNLGFSHSLLYQLCSFCLELEKMMPQPLLLVFLPLIYEMTSQFECKQQQLVIDVDSSTSISQKQQQVSKG
jgi:hypothetical protein